MHQMAFLLIIQDVHKELMFSKFLENVKTVEFLTRFSVDIHFGIAI